MCESRFPSAEITHRGVIWARNIYGILIQFISPAYSASNSNAQVNAGARSSKPRSILC